MTELELTPQRLGRVFWSMVWRSVVWSIPVALAAYFIVGLFEYLAVSSDGADPISAHAKAGLWYSIILIPVSVYIWWRALGKALKVRQPGFRITVISDN